MNTEQVLHSFSLKREERVKILQEQWATVDDCFDPRKVGNAHIKDIFYHVLEGMFCTSIVLLLTDTLIEKYHFHCHRDTVLQMGRVHQNLGLYWIHKHEKEVKEGVFLL